MKQFVADSLGNLAFALCELAFRTDCWGPFAWFYSWGNRLYDLESRLCQRWGLDDPWTPASVD